MGVERRRPGRKPLYLISFLSFFLSLSLLSFFFLSPSFLPHSLSLCFCALFRATLVAYGSPQEVPWATTISLQHSLEAVHSNPGALTHGARPGIKGASSWMLVWCLTPWTTMGAPFFFFFFFNFLDLHQPCDTQGHHRNSPEPSEMCRGGWVWSPVWWYFRLPVIWRTRKFGECICVCVCGCAYVNMSWCVSLCVSAQVCFRASQAWLGAGRPAEEVQSVAGLSTLEPALMPNVILHFRGPGSDSL